MPAPSSGTQAIDRAASLLEQVVEADEPVTFTELSDESGLAKSTLSRLLAALQRHHLLERTGSGAFVSGPLFALYAARHDPWSEVARLAQPVLERIGAELGETVNLGIPRGRAVVQIAQVDSQYVLGARDWIGVAVPPHCSALGKVFFAYGGLDVPDGDLATPTDRSIATATRLRFDIDRTRQRGYACTVDELESGLTAVAAPVRGRDGDVIAAVGVSGPTSRLQGRVAEVGRLLITQSGDLSGLLGRRTRTKEGAA